MKLTSILIVTSFLTASAFGATPTPGVTKVNSAVKPAFRKDSAPAARPLWVAVAQVGFVCPRLEGTFSRLRWILPRLSTPI
jgi:hypothetical protein